jgi:transglutaminase-like putative cysteine protease
MIFDIRHVTRYTYDRPVFLEPHTIRMRPRCDSRQHVQQFALAIEPEPTVRSEFLNIDGNVVTRAWFAGLTNALTIRSACVVETTGNDPFDYLLDISAGKLPMRYAESLQKPLAPFSNPANDSDSVRSYAQAVAHEREGLTLPFLYALCDRIYRECRCVIRAAGHPLPASETLAKREGSCRDLAFLFVEACRTQGIAARFVSGYHEGDPDQTEHHLHAWAEVYLPGGGWRGYDPTYGLAVADRHVAVGTSAIPANAAPVTGTFRGTGAKSEMQIQLDIRVGQASKSS